MSEKENTSSETVEESPKPSQKTIDLIEWQRKNKAYLEKRAKEKSKGPQRDILLTEARKEKDMALEISDEAADTDLTRATKKSADQLTSDDGESNGLEIVLSSEEKVGAEEEFENEAGPLEGNKDLGEDFEVSDEDTVDEKADTTEVEAEGEDATSDDETAPVDNEESQIEEDTQEGDSKSDETAPLSVIKGKKGRKKRGLSRRKKRLFRLIGLFFGLTLVLVLTGYLISPWSKLKQITVEGHRQATEAEVLASTGLYQNDYTIVAALNQGQIASQVESNLVWVKNAEVRYVFPVSFTIAIEEHQVIGYVKDGSSYYPVLSSGDTLDAPVTADLLPPQFVWFNMTDLDLVKEFVIQLSNLKMTDYTSRIVSVEVTPSQASDDLLTLEMVDGHTIYVPLSDLAEKIVYYDQLLPTLYMPSYIDMEVGVYTYAK